MFDAAQAVVREVAVGESQQRHFFGLASQVRDRSEVLQLLQRRIAVFGVEAEGPVHLVAGGSQGLRIDVAEDFFFGRADAPSRALAACLPLMG